MKVLDLFSGIGGFSLGLERAGMTTVAFCEIEPYCRAVLRKHWPEVPIYEDIRTLTADVLERDGIGPIDAICGGFPCQDLSHAGKRAGLEGERSGLWGEYRRLIGELRPRFVIVENVPGLLSLGMGTVLGDLAALGYDAVWDCIPASALCAPHRRDRVWIVAHDPHTWRSGGRPDASGYAVSPESAMLQQLDGKARPGHDAALCGDVAHTQSQRRGEARGDRPDEPAQWAAGRSEDVANASRSERERKRTDQSGEQGRLADNRGGQSQRGLGGMADGVSDRSHPTAWMEEPEGVPRVIKGQENRAARLKALGNAVVPQIPELIGRAIMESAQ